MEPISFHKQETTYKGDEDIDVGDLQVLRLQYASTPGLVSCWRPSWRERLKILFGKPVYLAILGMAQPPVLLTADAEVVLGEGASNPELELATW